MYRSLNVHASIARGGLPKELKELEKEDPLPGRRPRFCDVVTLEPDLQKPGVQKQSEPILTRRASGNRTKRLTGRAVMRARPYDAKRPSIEPQRVDGQHSGKLPLQPKRSYTGGQR